MLRLKVEMSNNKTKSNKKKLVSSSRVKLFSNLFLLLSSGKCYFDDASAGCVISSFFFRATLVQITKHV